MLLHLFLSTIHCQIQNADNSSVGFQVNRLLPLLRGPPPGGPGPCRGPNSISTPQCQQNTNNTSQVQSNPIAPSTSNGGGIANSTEDSNLTNTALLAGTICSSGVVLIGLAYLLVRRKRKTADIENFDKSATRNSTNSISFSSEELNVLETEMSYKDMKRLSFAIPAIQVQ